MSGIKQLALACRDAALQLGQLPTEAKNRLLSKMADALEADAVAILSANAKDLEAATEKGISGAMLATSGCSHQLCKPPSTTNPARKKPTSSASFKISGLWCCA